MGQSEQEKQEKDQKQTDLERQYLSVFKKPSYLSGNEDNCSLEQPTSYKPARTISIYEIGADALTF